MRSYGTVFTSIWASGTFRAMNEDGRALALYLLTCAHSTIAGVFRLPDGYVSEDMQWELERVSKGFTELFDKGFATRCNKTKWVYLHKHFDFNPLENPNQRKSAAKIAQSVPDDCGWKLEYMRLCGVLLGVTTEQKAPESKPLEVAKSNPFETLSKPFLNQEQEQEQQQQQYQQQDIKHTQRGVCDENPISEFSEKVYKTDAATVCQTLRKMGMADVNPGHPKLLKLIEHGASLAEFELAASKSIATKKSFAYALGMLAGLRQEAAAMPAGSALVAAKAGASEPAWRREQRERTEKAVPGIAAKNSRDFENNGLQTFEAEVKNVTAIALG